MKEVVTILHCALFWMLDHLQPIFRPVIWYLVGFLLIQLNWLDAEKHTMGQHMRIMPK